MGTDAPGPTRRVNEHSIALAREWRRLGRAATAVAVFTSPALFVVIYVTFMKVTSQET